MANLIASAVVPPGRVSLGYAELLLKGIKPEWMARFAAPGGHIIKSNHPVFVFGHLSLYSSRMMELIGQPAGVTARPEGWEGLFKAGVACQDDPAVTIYPSHEKVIKQFFDGYRAVIGAVEATDDAVLSRPNPAEGRFKEMAPTVGAAVAFLLGGHPMSHLGQLSAWRRAYGLGEAM